MRRVLALAAATVTTLFNACSDASGALDPAPGAPAFSFVNGPDELPNVLRFSAGFATGIQDPGTGLVAVAGLPDDPTQDILCGGTEPIASADFQEVGLLQEVIHSLAVGGDVNIHVYDRSTFQNTCVSTPIAQGTGRVMYTDNDRFVSGTRANTWGFRFQGPVTLATGETTNLEAHNRFIVSPSGEFRLIHRQVRLSAE